MKCAIGCLITDENYHVEMEGETIFTSAGLNRIVVQAVEKSIGRKLDNTDLHLLAELQDTHDLHLATDWEWQLHMVERRFFPENTNADT